MFAMAEKTGMLAANAPDSEMFVWRMCSADLAFPTRLGALGGQGRHLAYLYTPSPGTQCSANTCFNSHKADLFTFGRRACSPVCIPSS